MKSTKAVPASPIHGLGALVTLTLDWLWLGVELPATLTGPGLLLVSMISGLICTIAVTLIQRYLAGEAWGAAGAKGLAMGILAGVPYPITGTIVGVPLLAWSGLDSLRHESIHSRAGQ